jgi:hypothetical protein
MTDKFYSTEINVQVVVALLKANGIRKIVASPGTTNYSLVGSLQSDPFFEIYSSVDERSAAYIACGMAAESGEPVVLTCTGATASRNYIPGLTEAYYRKLPVLAITSHQGTDRIGQLIAQNVDRRSLPNDIANLSVELPVVKDDRDRDFVVMETNKAMLELRRNGGGPVHINIMTTYSRDFSVKQLPAYRVMRRYEAWDELPTLEAGKVCVFVGSHVRFTEQLTKQVDRFCATHDAVVICDHTSGYYGRYRLQPGLLAMQQNGGYPVSFDLMIHIGEVSAAHFVGRTPVKEVWRVNADGELRDPFKKLTCVFQMSEEAFFRHYGKDKSDKHSLIDFCHKAFSEIYSQIPELPFSNVWVAMQLSSRLPQGCLFHFSASNTRRCWNMFPLPEGVESASNVGCCGIDGTNSSALGASLVNLERLTFFATGDLAFFYDMNALGNRHVGRNLRILLINNGVGAEFKLSSHPCFAFQEEANPYMAAAGHYGNKSRTLVKHYAEDLGFQYLSAANKEEFAQAVETFVIPRLTDKPMLFEVFTSYTDENDAMGAITTISFDLKEAAKHKVADAIRSMVGEQTINKLKSILKK